MCRSLSQGVGIKEALLPHASALCQTDVGGNAALDCLLPATLLLPERRTGAEVVRDVGQHDWPDVDHDSTTIGSQWYPPTEKLLVSLSGSYQAKRLGC